MATKLTKYSYHASIVMPNGKQRQLFTNDTVARTKVLHKAGLDIANLSWTKLDPAMTKSEFASGKITEPSVAPAESTATEQEVA